MAKINLAEFEKKVVLRSLRMDDFDQLIALQTRCFPGMKPWTREQIDSQLKLFPEGQICIEHKGKLIASSNSLIVEFARYTDWHNWKEIADSGMIRNHAPRGDTMYGIEIMVDPKFRGMKLSRRLYDERKRIARDRNLQRIVIGGRIPGYGKHADKMSAYDYVERVIDKTLVDPVLTPQLSNGFVLKRLIPDYFPTDSESRGYATFLEWSNLAHVPPGTGIRRAASQVRIAAVQYQMRRVESFEEFGRQCEYFVDVASDYKADFVVFPELFTNQLLSIVKAERPGLAARALAEFTPRYLEFFTRLAVKYNVNIIGGSQFTLEGHELYNVAYLFRRDGTLGRQEKLHVTPNERRWWGVMPGRSFGTLDTDCGRVCILICYDVEFPELGRLAASQGANILFVPFNTDERYGYLRIRYCAHARCIENHVYAVISGCVGNLPFVENADIHYAQSGIFEPSDIPFSWEAVAAECTPNIETLIIHDVDLDLLRHHRRAGTVQNWNDRRTDLYRVAWSQGGERKEV